MFVVGDRLWSFSLLTCRKKCFFFFFFFLLTGKNSTRFRSSQLRGSQTGQYSLHFRTSTPLARYIAWSADSGTADVLVSTSDHRQVAGNFILGIDHDQNAAIKFQIPCIFFSATSCGCRYQIFMAKSVAWVVFEHKLCFVRIWSQAKGFKHVQLIQVGDKTQSSNSTSTTHEWNSLNICWWSCPSSCCC